MKKRVIFISSTGGHFSELMMLKPIFENYDFHLITEKTKSTISLKDEYKDRMHYLVYGTRVKKVKYFFKVVLNTIKRMPPRDTHVFISPKGKPRCPTISVSITLKFLRFLKNNSVVGRLKIQLILSRF